MQIRATTEELGLCIEDAHAHRPDGSCDLIEEIQRIGPMLMECGPFRDVVGTAVAHCDGNGNLAFATIFIVGIKTGQMLLKPELAYQYARPKRRWWSRIFRRRA